MKQYTTPEQTAKLIELGFKPPMWRVARKFDDQSPRIVITSFGKLMTFSYEDVFAYSVGELIEMLPPKIDGRNLVFERYVELGRWLICYEDCLGVYSISAELCDALYDMVVCLKEKGVI